MLVFETCTQQLWLSCQVQGGQKCLPGGGKPKDFQPHQKSVFLLPAKPELLGTGLKACGGKPENGECLSALWVQAPREFYKAWLQACPLKIPMCQAARYGAWAAGRAGSEVMGTVSLKLGRCSLMSGLHFLLLLSPPPQLPSGIMQGCQVQDLVLPPARSH